MLERIAPQVGQEGGERGCPRQPEGYPRSCSLSAEPEPGFPGRGREKWPIFRRSKSFPEYHWLDALGQLHSTWPHPSSSPGRQTHCSGLPPRSHGEDGVTLRRPRDGGGRSLPGSGSESVAQLRPGSRRRIGGSVARGNPAAAFWTGAPLPAHNGASWWYSPSAERCGRTQPARAECQLPARGHAAPGRERLSGELRPSP